MPRTKSVDTTLLEAALQGLELQRQKIDEQIREVRSRLGGPRRGPAASRTAAAPARKRRGRRPLSAEARKRIAAAQKKRWAAFRKQTGTKKGAAAKKAATTEAS